MSASTPSLIPADFEESLWRTWCENLERLGLADETLGRFAPSLLELPRTLWTVQAWETTSHCDFGRGASPAVLMANTA